MSPLPELKRLGQGLSLDSLSDVLLDDVEFARLVAEYGHSSMASHPSILYKAIANGGCYHDDLARLNADPLDAEQRYETMLIPATQAGCDPLQPVYDQTNDHDGSVSIGMSPKLTDIKEVAVRAGVRLHQLDAPGRVRVDLNAISGVLQADGLRIFDDAYTARLEFVR